jgi:ATP synthase I chain
MNAAHWVVGTQAIIAIFSAGLLYYLLGKDAAKAAFFGGVVATANGLILLRKVSLANKAAATAPMRAMSLVYSGVVTRFILVLMLFGLGFGVLHLQPVPALFVFALAQLAYGWGFKKSYKDIL